MGGLYILEIEAILLTDLLIAEILASLRDEQITEPIQGIGTNRLNDITIWIGILGHHRLETNLKEEEVKVHIQAKMILIGNTEIDQKAQTRFVSPTM